MGKSSIKSPNGRFELNLEKMDTDGISVYDRELSRVVRNFDRHKFVALNFSRGVFEGVEVSHNMFI